MKYALGVFIILPLLLFLPMWLTAGGDANATMGLFIHAPTIFAFLVVYAGVLFVTGEFKTFVRAANALFSKKYQISAEDCDKGISLLKLGTKVTIAATVFYSFGSLIFILRDLVDYEALGPMLAILILVPMYAAMIILIFIQPAIHILKTRKAEEEKPSAISEKQVINKLLELCYKQGISPEEIINANEITFKS